MRKHCHQYVGLLFDYFFYVCAVVYVSFVVRLYQYFFVLEGEFLDRERERELGLFFFSSFAQSTQTMCGRFTEFF